MPPTWSRSIRSWCKRVNLRQQTILDLRAAQDELAKLSLVASKTDNAVIITDKEGLIEWVNDGFTRLTGYTLAEVLGKRPGAILQGPLSDPETVSQDQGPLAGKGTLYRRNHQLQ